MRPIISAVLVMREALRTHRAPLAPVHAPLLFMRASRGKPKGTVRVSFGRAIGGATPDKVAAACDDARPIGDGSRFIARCPNPKHFDRHRSFSIGPGHSQATVVNCFARCDPIEVLSALRERGVVVGRPRGDSYPGSRPALSRPVGKLALVADDPWRIVLPVPDDAPVLPSMRRGQHWVYRDAEGRRWVQRSVKIEMMAARTSFRGLTGETSRMVALNGAARHFPALSDFIDLTGWQLALTCQSPSSRAKNAAILEIESALRSSG